MNIVKNVHKHLKRSTPRNIKRILNRLSLRTKVLFVFLVIMGLLGYRVSFSARYYIVEVQGQEQLGESLRTAQRYLDNHIERFDSKFSSLAHVTEYTGVNYNTLSNLYEAAKMWDKVLCPDFFSYIDTRGDVIYSCNGSYSGIDKAVVGQQFMFLQSVQKALTGHKASGLEIIPRELLEKEKILDKSRIALIPTSQAASPDYRIENRAMAVVSAQPVYINDTLTGALVAGHIINNRHDIVDQIYRDFHTSATIFLDTVRISTTVLNKQGQREVGTLLPDSVREEVLKKGKSHSGRAFTINEWYIVAYEPIRDLQNRIIGVMGVGVKEAPLLNKQKELDKEIKFTLVILTLIFVLALYWLYRSIVMPIHRMSSWALSFAKGELDIPIQVQNPNVCWKVKECASTDCPVYGKYHIKCWLVPKTPGRCLMNGYKEHNVCLRCKVYKLFAGNEVDQLIDAFNYMAVSIQEHTDSLHHLNIELEQKNYELISRRDELECRKQQLEDLNRELEESMKALDDSQSIIYALAVAVEAKDPYLRGHSERVAEYSVKLAERIGIPSSQFEIIKGAAILHDIGKIGISGSILRNPGALSAIEFQQIKKHPTIGEHICFSLKFAKDMLPIIRHHHEYYNGRGYPDRLKGKEIPLMARIVAIADAFDAMISDRPYRPRRTAEEALCVLEIGAGRQWDPGLVRVFIVMVREELINMKSPLEA